MTLGAYLRQRREEAQRHDPLLSIRELAGRVGVEPSYLSRVEQGKVPPSEMLLTRLAPFLGEDPDALLAMSGKVSQELQAIICQRPQLFASLLRQLKDAPDEALERMARQVRDGDW